MRGSISSHIKQFVNLQPAYQSYYNEKDYQNIEVQFGNPVKEGACGETVKWKLDEKGCLTISGTGNMDNFSEFGDFSEGTAKAPWFAFADEITSIELMDGITSVGDYAFYKMSHAQTVTLPEGLTRIGESAFSGCESLTSLEWPRSVTTLADSVLAYSGLTSFTVPKEVEFIDKYALAGCKALTNITVEEGNPAYVSKDGVVFNKAENVLEIYPASGNRSGSYEVPKTVTEIAYAAFHSNTLASITMPDTVQEIGVEAFFQSSELASVQIPSGVESIRDFTFYGSETLRKVRLPAGLASIGFAAFGRCSALESISIPGSVKEIGMYAFDYCDNLGTVTLQEGVSGIDYGAFLDAGIKTIYLPKSLESIGTIAFHSYTNGAKINEVHYAGTQTDWEQVKVSSYNDLLLNAEEWKYESMPSSTELESEIITVKHGNIDNLKPGMTRQDFLDVVDNDPESIIIRDQAGNEVADGKPLGTGYTVQVTEDGEPMQIIVYGDAKDFNFLTLYQVKILRQMSYPIILQEVN